MPLLSTKRDPKVVTKTRNGMFYSSRRRRRWSGACPFNCHFGQSVRPSRREQGRGRRGGELRVARKESKLRRFDICFVQTSVSQDCPRAEKEERRCQKGCFTNWCRFEFRRCVTPSVNAMRVATTERSDDDGAKKGPKNSYEYLNDDDDAMEFSSVLSCGMPLFLLIQCVVRFQKYDIGDLLCG